MKSKDFKHPLPPTFASILERSEFFAEAFDLYIQQKNEEKIISLLPHVKSISINYIDNLIEIASTSFKSGKIAIASKIVKFFVENQDVFLVETILEKLMFEKKFNESLFC